MSSTSDEKPLHTTALRRLVCCVLLLGPAALAQAASPEQARLWREQARAHEHGEGVVRDLDTARDLYCKAALAGDNDARYSLGWIYANGRGTERHDGYAVWYLRQAADAGDTAAHGLLARLSSEPVKPPCIVQAEAAEAQRHAEAWVASAMTLAGEQALAAATAAAERTAATHYQRLVQTPDQKKIMAIVQRLAPQYGVHPGLAYAVIRAESNFDPLAISPKNAQGLMQLIPETAARFNVTRPLDPEQNIRGGLAYLRWLLAYFKGDVPLAVAAYNAGEGAVERYRGVPPFPETQGYVRRIQEVFNLQQHPFDARITAPSPELPRIAQRPRS